MNKSGKMSTISTEWAESIDREDDQETPPGADRLTNFNTTLANNNSNNICKCLDYYGRRRVCTLNSRVSRIQDPYNWND